jgi:hypothetical protein
MLRSRHHKTKVWSSNSLRLQNTKMAWPGFDPVIPSARIQYATTQLRSRGSSVSIVSDYGLDDQAIEVRSPAEAKGFFLYPLCPDRLWCPPSVLYNGYRGAGVKRGQGVTLTTHAHLVPRSWMNRSYTFSPSPRLYRCVVGLISLHS